MDKPKKFWRFLCSFTVKWFVLMSGSLCVPLTVAGCILKPGPVQKLLIATGLICGVFAAFYVWLEQNGRAESAEMRAKVAEQELSSHDIIEIGFNSSEVLFFLERLGDAVVYKLSNFPITIHNISKIKTLFNVVVNLEGDRDFLYSLFEGGENSFVYGLWTSNPFAYSRPASEQLDPGRWVELNLADNAFGAASNNEATMKTSKEFKISVSAKDVTKKVAEFRYDPDAENEYFKRLS